MFIPLPVIKQNESPEQIERNYFDKIRFDSHKWVEYDKGYAQCAFCGQVWTSTTPINYYKLCHKNPHLFLSQLIQKINDEAIRV